MSPDEIGCKLVANAVGAVERALAGGSDARESPRSRAPFACPNCGATDQWRAHYYLSEAQGLELFVGADGEIEEGEYDHRADNGDATENECYVCGGCDHEITRGSFLLLDPKVAPVAPFAVRLEAAVRLLLDLVPPRRLSTAGHDIIGRLLVEVDEAKREARA